MKVVLYFQLPQRTTTPEKQAGVQDIAKKRGWHLQVIDMLPTAARMEELRAFWDPIGAIVECGGSYTEIDVSVFARLPPAASTMIPSPPDVPPHGNFFSRAASTSRSSRSPKNGSGARSGGEDSWRRSS